jgi:carboxypeptidase C (cathepsin A)
LLTGGGPTNNENIDAYDPFPLDGVILFGQILDYTTSQLVDKVAMEIVPSLAATAWYHASSEGKKMDDTLEVRVEKARQFVADKYLHALYKGDALDDIQRHEIAEELAHLIGLSTSYILSKNLRVTSDSFNDGRGLDKFVVGIFDSRHTLPRTGLPSTSDPLADDATMSQLSPGFIAATNDYFRSDLGIDLSRDYRPIVVLSINSKWDYSEVRNFALDLATAMRRNPAMRLFVGMGYYDLSTPLGSAEYTVTHAGIDPSRVMKSYYAAGHMTYIGRENRQKTNNDLREFICKKRGSNQE